MGRHNVRIWGERRVRKFKRGERERAGGESRKYREKKGGKERESGHSSIPLETDAV